YRKQQMLGSDLHIVEFHPDKNPSQIVKSPGGKRQQLSAFKHQWYADRGWKIKAAINLGFFNMNDASSLHMGLLARDSGFVEGVPNNGMECWLNKDGTLNIKQLNLVGVKGIGTNWTWGTSLAYSLV